MNEREPRYLTAAEVQEYVADCKIVSDCPKVFNVFPKRQYVVTFLFLFC